MTAALLFVLAPLVFYVAAFAYETFVAFVRLGNRKSKNDYLDATWEVTHTFMIFALAAFAALFSDNIRDVAPVAFLGLSIAVSFFALRGVFYLALFYIREPTKRQQRNWVDSGFAFSHLGVWLGICVLLMQVVPKVLSIGLVANTHFIPWMIPGLVLLTALCALPIASLYTTKKN